MPSPSTAYLACQAIYNVVAPVLADLNATDRAAAVVRDKGNGHTAHQIDLLAEQALFEALSRIGYAGTVFSEERGLVALGNQPRLIVCDPYCNSTLTFRGIRESAIAVHEYSLSGDFLSAAIADMQVPQIVWTGSEAGVFRSGVDSQVHAVSVKCSSVAEIGNAFLVISLLKPNRRRSLPTSLLHDAGLVSTIDGAIVAARIALGKIDGFIDISVGQPSYEAIAYALVERAGGVVVDDHGAPIDFAGIARSLSQGSVSRHRLIAAATSDLADAILKLLADEPDAHRPFAQTIDNGSE